MTTEFNYCPRCGSDRIYETDYELEDGIIDTDGRACNECDWEGSVDELVTQDKDSA